VWPGSLRKLWFGDRFNQPIVWVSWPTSLQHLRFGYGFHQPVVGVRWPTSLLNVICQGFSLISQSSTLHQVR